MNENQPLVSVISLVYNSGRNCVRSYESLLKQTYTNYEHIIIDDGSTDDSVSVIKDWIDQNKHECQFIVHKKNQGICKTANDGLKVAKGKYWAFLSDDLWLPEHLEHCLELMEKHASDNVGFVCGATNVVDPNINHLHEFSPRNTLLQVGCPLTEVERIYPTGNDDVLIKGELFYNYLFYVCLFYPITALISMEASQSVGGFDEKLPFEDYDFAFRVSRNYNVLYTARITTKYVRHPSSFTISRKDEFLRGDLIVLKKHAVLDKKFDKVRAKSICIRLIQLQRYYTSKHNIHKFLYYSYLEAKHDEACLWWLRSIGRIVKDFLCDTHC